MNLTLIFIRFLIIYFIYFFFLKHVMVTHSKKKNWNGLKSLWIDTRLVKRSTHKFWMPFLLPVNFFENGNKRIRAAILWEIKIISLFTEQQLIHINANGCMSAISKDVHCSNCIEMWLHPDIKSKVLTDNSNIRILVSAIF